MTLHISNEKSGMLVFRISGLFTFISFSFQHLIIKKQSTVFHQRDKRVRCNEGFAFQCGCIFCMSLI